MESLAVRGKSEQRTTTRPQISEIEIVNMEPYSHPSQLGVAVVDVKSWKKRQSLGKPETIKDSSQLAERFTVSINYI